MSHPPDLKKRLTALGIRVLLGVCLASLPVASAAAVPATTPQMEEQAAAQPYLVADLNSTGAGSEPGRKVVMQGVAYFAADDGMHGVELWRSDGTAAGTWLVADIFPGASSATPTGLAVAGGQLFFAANDGLHGTELWVSDGTAPGTHFVRDINTAYGWVGAGISDLTPAGGRVFFRATQGSGYRLWLSDGTEAGTVSLPYAEPTGLTEFGGKLLYAAYALDFSRYDLWITDGTAEGTTWLGALPNGSGLQTARLDTTLLFTRHYNDQNYGLWRTDGTLAGTSAITDTSPYALTTAGGHTFFSAPQQGQTALWATDGTVTGTRPLTNVYASDLTNVDGTLFFIGPVRTLWKSDGTPAGTVVVRAGFDESWCSGFPPCGVAGITAVGQQAYFAASSGAAHGIELWVSDGTADGTRQVAEVAAGDESSFPKHLINLNGTLLFTADGPADGPELWRSDGTPGGTSPVGNIHLGSLGSSPIQLAGFEDRVYFQAGDEAHGRELWRSDGSTGGTELVSDLNPTDSSRPAHFVPFTGKLFFRAMVDGRLALMQTDGTAAGTDLIRSFAFSLDHGSPYYRMQPAGDRLFFTGYGTDIAAGGLWSSDGTTTGTQLVKAFDSYGLVGSLTTAKGWLYFGYDGLWRSDGTPENTGLVKSFAVGPSLLVAVNNTLYFTAGGAVWRSDGTEAGTWPIENKTVNEIIPFAGGLVLAAADPSGGALWYTDGQAGAATLIRDGFDWGVPKYLTVSGNQIFFQGATGEAGRELWRTDGTAGGTWLVRDIYPNPAPLGGGNSLPAEFCTLNGRVYFSAEDGQHGRELWVSDGTEAGTHLAGDLYPGLIGSDPTQLTVVDGRLYFAARHVLYGTELWALNPGLDQLTYLPQVGR